MTERHRDLARAVDGHLDRWGLRADGPTRAGDDAHVVPVLTSEGTAAVLRVSPAGDSSEHAHLVLRRWAGDGAVRLLRADPPGGAVLMERAHPRSLRSVSVTEACAVVAGLYRRLHVPPMPQLRSVTGIVASLTATLEALPRSAPIPRRLVEQVVTLGRELTAGPVASEVVLHGNLHYDNVLAAQREPWLAIAPRPVNGDRHFELAPMLWHRWDELAGTYGVGIRDGLRLRFSTLVDTAGLDEDLARAWILIRVVHAWTRGLRVDRTPDAAALTRYAAIAKAVQD